MQNKNVCCKLVGKTGSICIMGSSMEKLRERKSEKGTQTKFQLIKPFLLML